MRYSTTTPLTLELVSGEAEEAVNEAEDEIIGELPALKKEATQGKVFALRCSNFRTFG